MRTILILSVVLSIFNVRLFAQSGAPLYSFFGDSISTNSIYIDNFFIDASTPLAPYSICRTDSLFSGPYGVFSVRFSKFSGYESEPGFCNVIEILRNDTIVLQLRGSNGFARLSSYVQTESQDFALVPLGTNMYALVFVEWVYASQPPMTTVVLVRNSQAKLVFNKPAFISAIVRQTGIFSMTLQTNTVEYNDNMDPLNTPDAHIIWWDGNVLRWQ